jgi:hypothetical protein
MRSTCMPASQLNNTLFCLQMLQSGLQAANERCNDGVGSFRCIVIRDRFTSIHA